jgi:protein farnesyltransferase subunit beta
VHALELLAPPSAICPAHAECIVGFLSRCQDRESGGFCGGPVPGQCAHLAPTYAAVNALVSIGTEAALACIDREALRRFLHRMKMPDGSFRMHDDGECDVRGSYCALSVASLCDLLDDELTAGAAEWLASCQTYEGGFGASPGEEAHGGYTFCGLAAAIILGRVDALRLPALAYWATQRQLPQMGGFQGRTNKLVDSCYSFWQGGAFPLLQAALAEQGQMPASGATPLFDAPALLDYLLICAQCAPGGLRDKPGRSRDFYHTCYALSGLSVAASAALSEASWSAEAAVPPEWLSQLQLTNPLYNIVASKAEHAIAYFHRGVPPPQPPPPPAPEESS